MASTHKGPRHAIGWMAWPWILLAIGLPASPLKAQVGPDAPTTEESDSDEEGPSSRQAKRWASEIEKLMNVPKAGSPRLQVEPVTVSPSTVTVIDRDDLRLSGVRYHSDALRMLPGMEVTRANSTDSNVSVRGFGGVSSSSQGILTLVDGFQVYNDFFGNTLWDGLAVPMSELDRVEVILGPGSHLYGPNAMHGLVDFRTRSPLDEFSADAVSFDVGLGSYGSRTATLVDVRRTERTALKTTLSWDDINRFDDRDANAKDKRFLELRLEHEPAEDHRVELTGGLTEYDMDLFLPQVLLVPPAELATDIRESFLRGRWSYEGWQLSASWRNFQSASIADQFYPDFDVDLDTVDLDLQYVMPAMGNHELVAGTGVRRSTFRTRNQDVARGAHSTDLGWVFLEDRLRLGEDWLLTAGLRLDQHSETGTSFSPRLAAVWQLRERESLRASFGTGFRNPSLRELWFDMPVMVPGIPVPLTIIGNDDLDPERMRSFEVGYRYRTPEPVEAPHKGGMYGPPKEPQNAASFGASLYYNLVDDLIEFSTVGASVMPTNQVDQVVYGAEVEGEYSLTSSWTAFSNINYGIRRMRDGNDRVESVPRYKANLGLKSTVDQRTRAMVWLHFFDETRVKTIVNGSLRSVEDTASYALLNGRIERTVPMNGANGTLYLQAFNLLDRDHREHAGSQPFGQVVMVGFSLHW